MNKFIFRVLDLDSLIYLTFFIREKKNEGREKQEEVVFVCPIYRKRKEN